MISGLLIVLSLLIALVLSIVPIPSFLQALRPVWPALFLFFWVYYCPRQVGVLWGFLTGLALDILSGTLLGVHALLFSLLAYGVTVLRKKYRHLSFLPLWVALAIFLVPYFALEYWILSLSGLSLQIQYWLALVGSVVCFPVVYAALQGYRRWGRI